MRTTIDRAGRVVIPKQLRDSLQLSPGQELEIIAREGQLEITTAPTPMHLEHQDGALMAIPETELPPLTADMVRDTLEQVRR